MLEIKTKEELDKVLSENTSDKLVVLKFSATWCQPCQLLGKTIKEIEGELQNVTFVEIDCDELDNSLLEEYNVTSVPKLVFYKGNIKVGDSIGNLSKSDLFTKINENLSK